MPRKILHTIPLPKNNNVRNEAINMLIDKMGIAKTAIFIRENLSQKSDYLKTKDALFSKKSIDDIYEEIKKNRE